MTGNLSYAPPIVDTIDSFKEYWAAAISLVNQTSIPAANHGYGMAAMDEDTSIASYGESLANFGAACHSRIDEEPGDHHGRYAGPAREHPAVLHGCQPATTGHHLRPSTATAAQHSP
jgi:hypothetical protein